MEIIHQNIPYLKSKSPHCYIKSALCYTELSHFFLYNLWKFFLSLLQLAACLFPAP